MTSLRRCFVNLFLFLFTASLGLVALEYGVRFFLPQYNPSGSVVFYEDEHEKGLILGPKSIRMRQFKNTGDFDVAVEFNQYGFRDRKDIAQSTPNDYFVVGDSFSFGWGVKEEERFSNLLQEKVKMKVYNISSTTDFIGYEKLVQYAIFHGAKIRKLVVGVCMENDLLDYEAIEAEMKAKWNGGKVQESGIEINLQTVKRYLAMKSAAYTGLTFLIHQNAVLNQIAVRLGLVVENIAGMRKNTYSEIILGSSVRRLIEITRPFDATILIVPSRGLWIGPNIQTEAAVHDKFVADLKKAGLRVADLRPVFERTGNPLQFHFKNDGHWNHLGHDKAAEVLAGILAARRYDQVGVGSPILGRLAIAVDAW